LSAVFFGVTKAIGGRNDVERLADEEGGDKSCCCCEHLRESKENFVGVVTVVVVVGVEFIAFRETLLL